MTHYIKTKDGKFAGSIGFGTRAPMSAPALPEYGITSPDIAERREAKKNHVVSPSNNLWENNIELPSVETWDANPAGVCRTIYRALQPRVRTLADSPADQRDHLRAEDSSYDWLVIAAAERCLSAQVANKPTLARLWGFAMEWSSLARTSTWEQQRDPRMNAIAANLVEYIQREETIEDFISDGYDREFAEEMESWHRRTGGRMRG